MIKIEKFADNNLFDTVIEDMVDRIPGWDKFDVTNIENIYPLKRYHVDLLDDENEVVAKMMVDIIDGQDYAEVEIEYPLPQYVSATWIAKERGVSQQSISEAGHRALNPRYRGSMIKPDALLDGQPIWLKRNAEKYIKQMSGDN